MSGSDDIVRQLANIEDVLHHLENDRSDIAGTVGNLADEVGGGASYLQAIDDNLGRIADVLEYFQKLVEGEQGGSKDVFGAGGSAPSHLHGVTGSRGPGGGPPLG